MGLTTPTVTLTPNYIEPAAAFAEEKPVEEPQFRQRGDGKRPASPGRLPLIDTVYHTGNAPRYSSVVLTGGAAAVGAIPTIFKGHGPDARVLFVNQLEPAASSGADAPSPNRKVALDKITGAVKSIVSWRGADVLISAFDAGWLLTRAVQRDVPLEERFLPGAIGALTVEEKSALSGEALSAGDLNYLAGEGLRPLIRQFDSWRYPINPDRVRIMIALSLSTVAVDTMANNDGKESPKLKRTASFSAFAAANAARGFEGKPDQNRLRDLIKSTQKSPKKAGEDSPYASDFFARALVLNPNAAAIVGETLEAVRQDPTAQSENFTTHVFAYAEGNIRNEVEKHIGAIADALVKDPAKRSEFIRQLNGRVADFRSHTPEWRLNEVRTVLSSL